MRRSAKGGLHSRPGDLREEQVGRDAAGGESLPSLTGRVLLAVAPFVVLLGLLLAHRWLFR